MTMFNTKSHSSRYVIVRAILHTVAYWSGIAAVWYFWGLLAAVLACITYHLVFLFSGAAKRHTVEAYSAFSDASEDAFTSTIDLEADRS